MKLPVLILSTLCLLSLSGCITAPIVMPTKPLGTLPVGQYHRVEKGQTLWRISKLYSADLETLVNLNKITDVTNIEVGQMILIPGAKKAAPPMQRAQNNRGAAAADDDFIWPLKGSLVGAYGQTVNTMLNKGINIQPRQETNIVASRSGRIVFYAAQFETYGKTIIIDHQDGFSTVYSGATVALVKPGDYITQGTPIARINPKNQGSNNYLHFEIRKGYLSENPNFYLVK